MQTLVRPSSLKAKRITPTMHRDVKPTTPIIKRTNMYELPASEWEDFLDVLAMHPPFAGMPFGPVITDNERLEVARLRAMGATLADLSKATGLTLAQLVKATAYVRRWYMVNPCR